MREVFRTTTLTVPLVIFSWLLFILVGCGGSSSGGDDTGDYNAGWVTIDSSSSGSNNIEYCNSTSIAGTAFISPTWYSNDFSSAITSTGVTVTWENETTGETGYASQYFGGLFSTHTWNASVPLAIGDNLIVITASDPDGNTGIESITAIHPETSYKISGKFVNQDGIDIGSSTPQFTVQLTGEGINRSQHASKFGFTFSCIRNGSYTLTPTSPYFYTFDPEIYDITINTDDIIDVDFATEAYFISGYFTWATNGAPRTNNLIQLFVIDTAIPVEEPFDGFGTFTDEDGSYNFAVPNGTYTIRPEINDSIPTSITVTVLNEDIENVNFVR